MFCKRTFGPLTHADWRYSWESSRVPTDRYARSRLAITTGWYSGPVNKLISRHNEAPIHLADCLAWCGLSWMNGLIYRALGATNKGETDIIICKLPVHLTSPRIYLLTNVWRLRVPYYTKRDNLKRKSTMDVSSDLPGPGQLTLSMLALFMGMFTANLDTTI